MTRAASPVRVARHDAEGNPRGHIELDPAFFGIRPHVAVMHQVVTAELAAARSGTHSTRTRAEARGGGAKPYRQKGTGRARQGSLRSPQFVGGGIALGPKPRDYRQRTPKKMVSLALRSALSDRAAEGRLAVVDRWPFDEPRTRDAAALLDSLDVQGKVLVVVAEDDWAAERSFSNLVGVSVVVAPQLTTYAVLSHDWILFSEATLPGSTTSEPHADASDHGAEIEDRGESGDSDREAPE